jgi:hypothetical protein
MNTNTNPEVLLAMLGVCLVWAQKITCFILAYLTIRLGYNLLVKGVSGEFKFNASLSGAKADLTSASPGLLFVLLGILLAAYAIQVDKSITLTPAQGAAAAPPSFPLPSTTTGDSAVSKRPKTTDSARTSKRSASGTRGD